jgi:hypothetical protein
MLALVNPKVNGGNCSGRGLQERNLKRLSFADKGYHQPVVIRIRPMV